MITLYEQIGMSGPGELEFSRDCTVEEAQNWLEGHLKQMKVQPAEVYIDDIGQIWYHYAGEEPLQERAVAKIS